MDVPDGRIVEMLAPDEGRDAPEEELPGLEIAGHRARLDQGGAFPVLAVPLVVELGGVGRDGERVARQMRAQAQVGTEHVTVARLALQEMDERAGEAHGQRHRALRTAIAEAVVVIEDDEVDIARVVELPCPVLAHGEDHEAALGHGMGRIVDDQLATAAGLLDEMLDRALDGEVGEAGERLGDTLQGPGAAEVGEAHQQRHPPADPPQARHQPGAVGGVDGSGLGLERFPGAVGPMAEKVVQQVRLGRQRLGEERAAAEDAVQQGAPGGLLLDDGHYLAGPGRPQGIPAFAAALARGVVQHPRGAELDRRHQSGPSPTPLERAQCESGADGSSCVARGR